MFFFGGTFINCFWGKSFFFWGHSEIVFGGNRFFGGKSNRVFFFFQKVNFVAKRTFWT